MRKAIEVNGEWKIERLASGERFGSFDTREEAEAAIATAERADQAAVSDPSQY
jgi:hypothetical protein